jgi:hypothetical protein
VTAAETAAAIEALAHRIRQRDAAMRDGEDYPDPEPFAAEYLAALRGQGWRVTAAKAYPGWKPPGDRTKNPATEDWHAIRAEWEARPHPHRSREDGVA